MELGSRQMCSAWWSSLLHLPRTSSLQSALVWFLLFFQFSVSIKSSRVMELFIFLVQVRLRTEVIRTPSLTQSGFELMTSRSWQYIPCHWDACSNHSATSDFLQILCSNISVDLYKTLYKWSPMSYVPWVQFLSYTAHFNLHIFWSYLYCLRACYD